MVKRTANGTTVEEHGRGSWKVTFPCTNHPSGKFVLIFTRQMVYDKKGGDRPMVPSKTCRCGRSFPVLAFIKRADVRDDGYSYLMDGDRCPVCQPCELLAIHTDHTGRLRMRVELRYENNQPVKFFDEKKHRWVGVKTVGIRRMTPDGYVFRLQPYGDRSHAKDGTPYADGKGERFSW